MASRTARSLAVTELKDSNKICFLGEKSFGVVAAWTFLYMVEFKLICVAKLGYFC